jgi:hypothetical protein
MVGFTPPRYGRTSCLASDPAMRFEIDHAYKFKYCPPRKVNLIDAHGRARTEFEIRELDDADAPVVALVGNPDTGGKKVIDDTYARFVAKPADVEGGERTPRKVRFVDGQFYVEAVPVEELTRLLGNIETINQTFIAAYSSSDTWKPGFAKPLYGEGLTDIWTLRRKNGGLQENKTEDDGGRWVGEKIRQQAAKMFIVDGATYELCREPVFAVTGKNGEYGVIECPEDPATRARGSHYGTFPGLTFTSCLDHASSVMKDAGVPPDAVDIRVVDPTATYYDGLAADFVYHMALVRSALSQEVLGSRVLSTRPSMVAAYHRLNEALEVSDFACPSVSQEMIDALETVLAAAGDSDIEEIVREIRKIDRSQDPMRVNLDHDTAFGLDMGHVGNFHDAWEKFSIAAERARHCLYRWTERPYGSTFDNGKTRRIASVNADGLRVEEVGSKAAAHAVGREVGVDIAEAERLVESGCRLFRVSTHEPWNQSAYVSHRKGTTVAMVAIDQEGQKAVFDCGRLLLRETADKALPAVLEHLEAMRELDEKFEQDHMAISIF